jgi:hypothetical protein
MSDPQDISEALDADKITETGDDEVIDDVYPPDRPTAVNDYGTTADEERTPEPLADFVRREEPDPLREALEREADEA